jgi:hypothetical protein
MRRARPVVGREHSPAAEELDGHAFWLGRDESRGSQMNVWYEDRSVVPTYATFEDRPRRLTLQGIDGWFVPLPTR